MILITGATGTNGTELIKLLAAQNIPVRAMVRHPEKAAAIALPGVELVSGDFDQPETLRAALQGVEKAFLLTPSFQNAAELQTNFVNEAKKGGVQHIVKLSQLGADVNAPTRFLQYHGIVEAAIKDAGITYTFLRPNLFMQAMLSSTPTIKAQNAIYAPIGEGRVSVVDVRDIAAVAFAAFTQDGHENQAYNITGPQALSHADMAATISEVVGRTIQFVDIPPATMREILLSVHFPEWTADGLLGEYEQWSHNEGAQVTSDVEDVTGDAPRSFQQFAHDYAAAFS